MAPADAAPGKPTILLVDDDAEALGFLTPLLQREGFLVLVATRGERALASMQQVHPDLVLLDAVMPEMDGFETCRRLKRMSFAASIPVIFMTALSAVDDTIRGLEAGGVDYVTKPVSVPELIARIRVHLAGAQLVASAHAAMDAAGCALFATSMAGQLLWATPTAKRILESHAGEGAGWLAEAVARLLQAPGPGDMVERTGVEHTGVERTGVERIGAAGTSLQLRRIGQMSQNEVLLRVTLSQHSKEEARLRARLPVTPREAEVLMWLARGKSNRDIAEILGLSPRTVNKHLEQIYAKLGVESRSAAVALAFRSLAE